MFNLSACELCPEMKHTVHAFNLAKVEISMLVCNGFLKHGCELKNVSVVYVKDHFSKKVFDNRCDVHCKRSNL